MLLASPWLTPAVSAATDAGQGDAQAQCAGPLQAFDGALAAAGAAQGVNEELRSQFLRHLQQCRAVYRYHLQELAGEFADLPATAYCHSVRREFVEAEELFDIAAARAAQLPLASAAERETAAAFFLDAGSALTRAVNGLFLLRHGICLEERIAPFDQHPFEGGAGRSDSHIQ